MEEENNPSEEISLYKKFVPTLVHGKRWIDKGADSLFPVSAHTGGVQVELTNKRITAKWVGLFNTFELLLSEINSVEYKEETFGWHLAEINYRENQISSFRFLNKANAEEFVNKLKGTLKNVEKTPSKIKETFDSKKNFKFESEETIAKRREKKFKIRIGISILIVIIIIIIVFYLLYQDMSAFFQNAFEST